MAYPACMKTLPINIYTGYPELHQRKLEYLCMSCFRESLLTFINLDKWHHIMNEMKDCAFLSPVDFPQKGSVTWELGFSSCQPEQAVEQTVELPVIGALMWRPCSGFYSTLCSGEQFNDRRWKPCPMKRLLNTAYSAFWIWKQLLLNECVLTIDYLFCQLDVEHLLSACLIFSFLLQCLQFIVLCIPIHLRKDPLQVN